MTFIQFIAVRLIRLYPTYLCASALGFFYFLFRDSIFHRSTSAMEYAISAVCAIFIVPTMGWNRDLLGIFPLDQAAWSLFWELAVNVIYVLALPILSTRLLLLFSAISGIILIIITLHVGSLDLGMTPNTFLGGAIRCLFSFSTGVLIYRDRVRWTRFIKIRPDIAFFILLLIFMADFTGTLKGVFDLLCVITIFPILLITVAFSQVNQKILWIVKFLAFISYPLYLLHGPLIYYAHGFYEFAFKTDPLDQRPLAGLATALLAVFASYMFAKFIDEPLRTRLRRCGSRHFSG